MISLRIKQYRQQNNMSQRQLAEKLGMKQPTLAKIETGTASDIKISTLYRICKQLDVSADWLLGLTDSQEANNSKKECSYTKEE